MRVGVESKIRRVMTAQFIVRDTDMVVEKKNGSKSNGGLCIVEGVDKSVEPDRNDSVIVVVLLRWGSIYWSEQSLLQNNLFFLQRSPSNCNEICRLPINSLEFCHVFLFPRLM